MMNSSSLSRTRWASVCRMAAIIGIVAFLGIYAAFLLGIRVNRTNSLPKGLYQTVDKTPEKGDLVSFWPRDTHVMREARHRGYILGGTYNVVDGEGYGLLLKRLMAVPGDNVSITDNGVEINGLLVPNTKPLEADSIGNHLPYLRFTNYLLRDDEVLLLSDHLPRSFDGRYFGIQERRQIVEVVCPLLTW